MTDEEIEQKFEKTKYLIPFLYDKLLKNNRIRAEKEDILAEGRLGLVQAIKNYRDSEGVSFSTYAYQAIKNRMLKYIRSLSSKIVKNTISNDGGNTFVFHRVKNDFNILEDRLFETELISSLKKDLNLIFEGLSDRDKLIFQSRIQGKSSSDIAKLLGVSKQRVSERYIRILIILKKALISMSADKGFPRKENYNTIENYKANLRKYLKRLFRKDIDLEHNLNFEIL